MGVKPGYKHRWKYKGHWKETKIAPGLWKFRFDALKHRKGSPKGGLRPGQSISWNIKGTQTAIKVSGRTYKTTFTGSKILRSSPE